MKTIKILLAFIILLGISCKKENQPEIIEPGSYFPVYPNSWWKYLVNDSIEIIDSTSPDYVLYNYKLDDAEYQAFVPLYYSSDLSPVGISGPIFRYDKLIWHKWYGYLLWPILREEVGFVFDEHPGDQYPEWIEKYKVESKSFNGKDSVLIFSAKPYYWYDPVTSQKRYVEYVKGIGLVSNVVFDTISNDTLSKVILIDYYVNDQIATH